jgi:DNA invertase Pin-like site-specific DNA recombinase
MYYQDNKGLMIIGYARTSTVEQRAGFEAQRRELEAAKCEKIFEEQITSIAERRELNNALDFAREGDVFVVTKMDRLARSVLNFMEIANTLERKNVKLQILNMGIDTRTPTGRLMLSLLRGIAEFEREIMLERQREGIAKAKSEGKYKGRKPLADVIVENVVKLDRAGIDRASIAKQLGIGIASVYRIVAKQQQEAA